MQFRRDPSNATVASASRWPRVSTFLLTVAVLALVTLNLLTLAVESVHISAFTALRSVLNASLPEATASKLLSRSPEHLSALKTEITARISSRVAKRAVLNAGKNVSSLAGELIPIAGTAIILALTASDIYDDCQTVKDMNELNATFSNGKHEEATVCGMKVPFL